MMMFIFYYKEKNRLERKKIDIFSNISFWDEDIPGWVKNIILVGIANVNRIVNPHATSILTQCCMRVKNSAFFQILVIIFVIYVKKYIIPQNFINIGYLYPKLYRFYYFKDNKKYMTINACNALRGIIKMCIFFKYIYTYVNINMYAYIL